MRSTNTIRCLVYVFDIRFEICYLPAFGGYNCRVFPFATSLLSILGHKEKAWEQSLRPVPHTVALALPIEEERATQKPTPNMISP